MKFAEIVTKVLLEIDLDDNPRNRSLIENYVKSAVREAHEAIVSVSSKNYRRTMTVAVPRGQRLLASIPDVFNQLIKSVYAFSELYRPQAVKLENFQGYSLEEAGNALELRTDFTFDYPTNFRITYIRKPILPPDTENVDVPVGIEYLSAQAKALYYFDQQTETYESFEAKASTLKAQMLAAAQVHSVDINSGNIDDLDGYDFYEEHI